MIHKHYLTGNLNGLAWFFFATAQRHYKYVIFSRCHKMDNPSHFVVLN